MQKTMYTAVVLLDHIPCDATSFLESNIWPHSASLVYTTAHFHDIYPFSAILQY
jgi:hypothetical protein